MCYRLWEAVELHRDIMLHLSAVILKLCNNLTPQWSNAQNFKAHSISCNCTYIWTDWHTHTHMPKGGLTWVLCNQAPSLPVFSPLPTPICLLRLTWWAWCHFPFLSLKNRRTKTGLCACALMWAIAKCFYNDVMLLASCSSSSSPPSLRLFRSLRRGHTQMQTQAKESVHNEKKKANEWWQLDNHDVHFTDVH